MKALRIVTFVAIALAASSINASAALITFVHTGSGSGSIGGVGFGLTDFTITATGDTDDVAFATPDTPYIDHTSASISITGVGTFDFITATRTFFADFGDVVGFSRAGAFGLDLFNGPANASLDGWTMQTSIGPVAGNGSLLQWAAPVSTTGGVLFFDSGSTAATFSATVAAPEPASMLLLGLGAVVAGVRRYRIRRA